MTNTKLLKDFIDRSGLKLMYIAESLGMTRCTLNNKIENRSQFKSEEIRALCDLLGIESLSDKERIFFA